MMRRYSFEFGIYHIRYESTLIIFQRLTHLFNHTIIHQFTRNGFPKGKHRHDNVSLLWALSSLEVLADENADKKQTAGSLVITDGRSDVALGNFPFKCQRCSCISIAVC